MSFTIVLVGRTNVGKSTLFNKLTHTTNSLVLNYPKLTRDRKYGFFKINDDNITIIDCAGIDIQKTQLEEKIFQQVILSIKEAHIIFFLVSARDGLTNTDIVISNIIRQYNKIIFLIINKIDGLHLYDYQSEFFSLGFKTNFFISATNGIGINFLINNLAISSISNYKIDVDDKNNHELISFIEGKKQHISNTNKKIIKIAIIGKPNVGKSTLINSLLNSNRMLIDDKPGTTRDSIWHYLTYNDKNYIFIDTAGLRKKSKVYNEIEKISTKKTLQTIKLADIVLLMLDSNNDISDQDLTIFNLIISYGCAVIIIFNKCDQISNKMKKNIIDSHKFKNIYNAYVHFISAKFNIGIKRIFKLIDKTFINSIKKIHTTKLMKILNTAIQKHHPPIIQGIRIKIKYAHIGQYNPIIIILHGNKLQCIPNYYKKYLLNYFHKNLNIKGIPVFLKFHKNNNPYV